MQWKSVEIETLGLEFQKDDSSVKSVFLDINGKKIKVNSGYDNLKFYEEKKETKKVHEVSVSLDTEFSKDVVYKKQFDSHIDALKHSDDLKLPYEGFKSSIDVVEVAI